MIKERDKAEFVGQLIDIFEDFLDYKGIEIRNEDRVSEDDALIYGDDYGMLQTAIEGTLESWELIKEDNYA